MADNLEMEEKLPGAEMDYLVLDFSDAFKSLPVHASEKPNPTGKTLGGY